MATISLSQLTHRYTNGHVGLHDIDLAVAEGEFVALVGPSGSGKTTLLRTIAGFLRPSSGTIRIGERTVVAEDKGAWIPPEHRRLGMVFQDHAVWPHLTVQDNVAYPLRRARVPRRDITARVDAVISQVGLSDYARRKPGQLSGGQRQRVALARAIVARPQALLLDEALSALDEPLRARLRREIKRLTREENLTTVHVTHDRAEALALADRLVVLDRGGIVQIGTPHELLTQPNSSFVASFLTDASVFSGVVSGGRFYPEHPYFRPPATTTWVSDGVHDGSTHHAIATVAPEDVRLRRLDPSVAPPEDHATVVSVLRGQYGVEVSIEWAGTTARVYQRSTDLSEADLVQVDVVAARLFVGASARHGAETGAR
ncbi:MAG: ABC transporter ATP-binding protein [Micrococcaceae bacterium]